MLRTALFLSLVGLLLVGCPPAYIITDDGHFAFEAPGSQTDASAPGVLADPFYGFRNAGPVLVGTQICLEPKPRSAESQKAWDNCPYEVVADAAEVQGSCYTFSSPGVVTLSVEPSEEPCGGLEEPPPTDSVSIEVVEPDGLTLQLLRFGERAAAQGSIEGDAGPWPSEWPAPWPDPLRVVEGEAVLLHVGLVGGDGERAAAFNSVAMSLSVVTLQGEEPETVPIFEADTEPADGPYAPGLRLRLAPGSRVQLRLQVGADSWTTGEVVAVPLDEITELEVLGAYSLGGLGEDSLPGSPLGARAVARDAAGNPVLGGPVRWTTSGARLQIVPGSLPGPISSFPLAGDDYVWLYDGCLAPERGAGTRKLTLRAKLGDLSDALHFTWERNEGEPDPDWEEPEYCTGGCSGCSASASPGSAAPLALLVALVLPWRRRRG